jgi:hypothetical protein
MENRVKTGIYAISSRSLHIVYFGVSDNVAGRVRRLRSDYGRGVKDRIIHKMGIGLARDVLFEVISYCSPDNFAAFLREAGVGWKRGGYHVFGMMLDQDGMRPVSDDKDLLPSGVEERIKTILELGMGRRELIEMLDKQIEYMRNKKDHGNIG